MMCMYGMGYRFSDRSALLRQACLWVRNTAARCPEYRGMLLDTGLEDVLRSSGTILHHAVNRV